MLRFQNEYIARLDRRRGVLRVWGMKKLLVTMFVALLVVGCGEEAKKQGGDSLEQFRGHKKGKQIAQSVKAPFVEKWDEW